MVIQAGSEKFDHSNSVRPVAVGGYDLVFEVGEGLLLRGAELEAYAGDVTGLLGMHGSGKTVLLQILAGLVRPLIGDVKINDTWFDFDKPAPWSVAYIPAAVRLDPRLKVWQWLEYRAAGAGNVVELDQGKVEALDRLGLMRLRNREIEACSPTERWLVELAAWLLVEPKVYLVDGALETLDDAAAARVAGVLKDEAACGAGVLVASGRRAVLAGVATRMLVLEDGRVREGAA